MLRALRDGTPVNLPDENPVAALLRSIATAVILVRPVPPGAPGITYRERWAAAPEERASVESELVAAAFS